jgi:hypothetical protein
MNLNWEDTIWDHIRRFILITTTLYMLIGIYVTGDYGFPIMVISYNIYIAWQAREIKELNRECICLSNSNNELLFGKNKR